eukprot:scaffold746_cov123-Cylindrotheca_fusiformis.AAC.18
MGDSEVVPLRYQVQRLTAEMDSVSSHSTWLEAELKSKNDQLAKVRATHASEMAKLRRDLDTTVVERDELDGEATTLRRQLQGSQNKLERTSQELREARKEASDNKAEMEQELVASQRLVTLQKEQMERLQERHESMVRQMQSMKQLAREAEEDGNTELQARQQEWERKTKEIMKEQAEDYKKQLAEYSRKLEEANLRCKKAEDGLLLMDSSSQPRPAHRPLAIANRPTVDDEPLNLTDLYGRVAEAEDALAAETLRRKKAEIRVARIEADIQARAPELIRQRREYEMAMERQEEYKNRLQAALEESQESRSQYSELQKEMGRLRKRNKELEEDTTELAKQVQVLLVSRSSSSTSTIAGSSQVPASVVDMQATNQRLLAEHRRLTATIADLEAKLQEDAWRNKVESYEKELETLREDRKRQEVLVEGIVQQRDLYRALVNKQDSNLLGSQSDEVSALQVVKTQSERTKVLEQEKKRLENDLAVARAELGTMSRDSEAASERLARYEALNSELSKSVDRLQVQVSAAKADIARAAADASFHKEKCTRVEETLQRSREEVARISASKGDLQRINQELQEAISKANVEASKLEGELEQANMKVRLATTQAETARKAEERACNETMQLRNELSKQGTLNETIQLIQASLSAKNAAAEQSSKDDIATLKKKLIDEEEKHKSETQRLNGLVSDHTMKIQLLESEKVKAVRESLEAKRAHLKSSEELQELKKKLLSLEAELAAAKKRLGDYGGEDDTETDLRNRIASLTEELGAAQKEVEVLKERVTSYAKLAKDNENAVAELTEAAKAAEASRKEEVGGLTSQVELAHSEVAKAKEVIADLTNDLAVQRAEREKAVRAVNMRLTEKESELAECKKDVEAARSQHGQLASEVAVLRTDASNAQNDYERELALHAAARTSLRAVKEEIEAEIRSRKLAEEQAGSLRSELAEQKSLFDQEKAQLEKTLKDCEKNLDETRTQNSLLHSQLEKIGDQIEKIQGGNAVEEDETPVRSSSELKDMQKTIAELREVVKFVRSEKEMIQAQLDSARRAADRERATAAIAKRSLDEVRAELQSAQEKSDSSGSVDIDRAHAKLRSAEERCRLLGESNSHLREEVKSLETKLSKMKEELENLQKSSEPTEKRQQELEAEKAGLLAEKESLEREINDWKGRVHSLLTKFNQVDPVEHDKVVKRVEKLEKDLSTLEAQKVEAEEDSKRIRLLAGKASSQLQQNKKLVEQHMKTIEQLTAEKDSLAKLNKASASKKENEELKEKLAKLENERANEKIQLTGANEMNDKLRERLRQYQKTIGDAKKKETLLNTKLNETKAKLSDLEGKQNVEEDKSGSKSRVDSPAQEEPGPTPTGSIPDTPTAKKASSGDELPRGASEEPSKPAEKTQPKVMPKVPAGGFKFGPSADFEESEPTPHEKPGTNPSESKALQQSKKRPSEPVIEEDSSNKSAALEPPSTQKNSETDESPADSTGDPQNGESIEAPNQTTAVARRPSGESKELSMKEKLLERKRKLMMDMMKRKQDQMKLSQRAKEDVENNPVEEPASKRTKVGGEDEKATEVVPRADSAPGTSAVETPEGSTIAQAQPQAQPNVSVGNEAAGKEGTSGSAVAAGASETPEDHQAAITSKSETEEAATTSSVSASVPSIFGSGTTKDSAVGQASGFGGGATFGSTAGQSFFAKKTEASPASTPAFGGAFLNIKPPGSSSATQPFVFGSSSSITLPTPSFSQQSNIFNAFSSPGHLNSGGVAPKPLFSVKKQAEEEAKEEVEEEDGEMEETK